MKDTIVDTNKVTKNDYPELEGKFITYFGGTFNRNGVVIGCNRAVGVTIVDANDKEVFFVCAPGPILKDHKLYSDDFIKNYDIWFNLVVQGIQDGHIDGEELTAIYRNPEYSSICTGKYCAYNR